MVAAGGAQDHSLRARLYHAKLAGCFAADCEAALARISLRAEVGIGKDETLAPREVICEHLEARDEAVGLRERIGEGLP